jgi:hypothetical protein
MKTRAVRKTTKPSESARTYEAEQAPAPAEASGRRAQDPPERKRITKRRGDVPSHAHAHRR